MMKIFLVALVVLTSGCMHAEGDIQTIPDRVTSGNTTPTDTDPTGRVTDGEISENADGGGAGGDSGDGGLYS